MRTADRLRTVTLKMILWGVVTSNSPVLFAQELAPPNAAPKTAEQLHKADETLLLQFKFLQDHSKVGEKCINCHEEQTLALSKSVHGKTGMLASMPPGTVCLTCHEVNHIVNDPDHVKELGIKTIKKLTNDDTCIRCHSNETIASIYKFPPHVPSNFEKSIHHRKAALGDKTAPTCADCHGTHGVLAKVDPNSPVHSLPQRAKVCAQCHDGANVNFAATFDHIPISVDKKPLEYFVLLVYRGLTLATFMALGFFMLLDLMSMVRRQMFGPNHQHKKGKVRFVERMDKSSRIQHFIMLATMIILFLTAWPLLSPESSAAQSFTNLFGGAKVIAWIHRISGIVMLVDFIYHFYYLYLQFRKGYRKFPMMPAWKDVEDMANIGFYFLGLRNEKPKFAQFAFHEKFEYWAVCFGTVMMGASGLILMFPIIVSRILPGSVISLATVIHASEALLAAVVLMIWHFYNVHLKPGVFPMNWSWLTGRMTTEEYEEEHGAHVEELRKQGKWEEDK